MLGSAFINGGHIWKSTASIQAKAAFWAKTVLRSLLWGTVTLRGDSYVHDRLSVTQHDMFRKMFGQKGDLCRMVVWNPGWTGKRERCPLPKRPSKTWTAGPAISFLKKNSIGPNTSHDLVFRVGPCINLRLFFCIDVGTGGACNACIMNLIGILSITSREGNPIYGKALLQKTGT